MRNNTACSYSIRSTVASYYSNFKSRDAIFNKQECIVIMLLCLNHGHLEHKQKADLHGYDQLLSYWSSYGNLYDITLSHCPDHSFTTRYCNKRPCMVLLLNGVAMQPRFISTMSWFSPGGPLAAKRTIHGSHSWSGSPGRPSTETQFAVDGPGDHLRHDIYPLPRLSPDSPQLLANSTDTWLDSWWA